MGANLVINLGLLITAIVFFVPHGMYLSAATIVVSIAGLYLLSKGMLRTTLKEIRFLNKRQTLKLVVSRAWGK